MDYQERSSRNLAPTKSAYNNEYMMKRDKIASGSLGKKATRKISLEEAVGMSKRHTAEIKSVDNPRLLNQRPRTLSNLETYSDISAKGDSLSGNWNTIKGSGPSEAWASKPRRKTSCQAFTTQRPRTHSSISDTSIRVFTSNVGRKNDKGTSRGLRDSQMPMLPAHAGSGDRKERTSFSAKTVLARTKSGPSIINNDSISADTKEYWQDVYKSRSVSDGDEKKNARKISTSSYERKEIIEKYIKDSEEVNLKRSTHKNIQEKTEQKKNGKSLKIKTEGQQMGKDEIKAGVPVPRLPLDNDKDNNGGSEGGKPQSKGWSLLRKKLLEVTKESQNDNSEPEKEKNDSELKPEEQSTAKYLKMLRQRLRNCKPADIVASSDVDEITKRKQDLEKRKKSNALSTGKNSFFEAVLTAHALSKQNKLSGRVRRQTSISSKDSARSLSISSLPDISIASKFKSSPHFQKAMKQVMGSKDMLQERDEEDERQERPKTLTSRYTF